MAYFDLWSMGVEQRVWCVIHLFLALYLFIYLFFGLFLSLLTSHLTITLKTTFPSRFYLFIFPLLSNFSVILPQFFCLHFTINILFSLTFNSYFSHIKKKKKVITLFLSIFIFLLVDFLILCFISTMDWWDWLCFFSCYIYIFFFSRFFPFLWLLVAILLHSITCIVDAYNCTFYFYSSSSHFLFYTLVILSLILLWKKWLFFIATLL